MNTRMLTIAMALGGVLLSAGEMAACGDKFVLLGRGSRVARAKYPSTILIFMNPDSRIPEAEKEFHLEAILKAAGHDAHIAENEAEVRKALDSGKYDLVLADAVDVPGLRQEARAVPRKPVILPLLYKPTAAELSAAEKEANCQVRASNKSSDLLVVIDESMQSRKKGIAAICDTAP
jgi:hypothetical protein